MTSGRESGPMVFQTTEENPALKTSVKPVVSVTGPLHLMPEYATPDSAGADLKAGIDSPLLVNPGERVLVPTGLSMAIPRGWEGQVRPRSGLAIRKGITLLNSPGTIDADYRGEVKVILINLGREAVSIEPGERIAQIVFSEVETARFENVDSLPETERGTGGFGSTGS